MVKIRCLENVKDQFEEILLLKKDKVYNFTPRNNQWTKARGFVGYVIDEENKKRWLTEKFKNQYFVECN